MNKKKLNRSLAAVIAVLMTSTTVAHENERNTNSTIDKSSGYSKIKKMAKSMGGLENILALQGIEYVANGTRFLPEQSFKPGGEFMDIGDYNYKFTNVFNKQQTRTEWILDIRFPFIEQRSFTEVINGDHGAVYGFDTIIAPPQAPMQSTRLGARVKQNLVSSPLALIHRASQYPDQVEFLGTTEFNGRRQQIVRKRGTHL
jgi:hypothetical protein